MTYQEFVSLCTYSFHGKADIREGQNLMNTLFYARRDLYSRVALTKDDPFYLDSRLPACRAWLKEHWEDQNATI